MTTLYGIPNCDTMKKARQWLDANGIDYHFHDFKKAGLPEPLLLEWVERLGWEPLLNRRGMMWRRLEAERKAHIDRQGAVQIMLETPTIIKRPVLDTGRSLHVGFSAAEYQRIFG